VLGKHATLPEGSPDRGRADANRARPVPVHLRNGQTPRHPGHRARCLASNGPLRAKDDRPALRMIAQAPGTTVCPGARPASFAQQAESPAGASGQVRASRARYRWVGLVPGVPHIGVGWPRKQPRRPRERLFQRGHPCLPDLGRAGECRAAGGRQPRLRAGISARDGAVPAVFSRPRPVATWHGHLQPGSARRPAPAPPPADHRPRTAERGAAPRVDRPRPDRST
jgi:hypothetical protein